MATSVPWINNPPSQNNQSRYVENGNQLLKVLRESLGRLQQKLHDELSSVDDLWDNRGDAQFRQYCPKDEEHLSNYIARHLIADLSPQKVIVVNREVQIRRGQKTDIYIDAILPQNRDFGIIKAIIEVKGCWNDGLDTAMQSQLVDKYLRDNSCPNGLYLVGWFNCEKWSSDDYRKGKAPKYSIDEARQKFSAMAATVMKNGNPNLRLGAYILDTALRWCVQLAHADSFLHTRTRGPRSAIWVIRDWLSFSSTNYEPKTTNFDSDTFCRNRMKCASRFDQNPKNLTFFMNFLNLYFKRIYLSFYTLNPIPIP